MQWLGNHVNHISCGGWETELVGTQLGSALRINSNNQTYGRQRGQRGLMYNRQYGMC